MNNSAAIDEYIAQFPKETQNILAKLRSVIRKAAPGAEEVINYGIPTFKLNGNLVHFAAYKKHIGFYPTPSAMEVFDQELSLYERAKGSVQFPIDKPLPLKLIATMVKFRVNENLEKARQKKSVRTCSKGHKFYKSTDCPVCPICEKQRQPKDAFFSTLSAPARRALENHGITRLADLSKFSEKEILQLHGMGPASIPRIQQAMKEHGISFSKGS